MKTFRITSVITLCTLALCQRALGQAAEPDLASAVAAAQQQYTATFAGHPQLFNGPEYLDYAKRYHTRSGHQFFAAPEKQAGRVYYNDHYFDDVQLAYDEVLDQVVLSPPNSPLNLRLVNERVRSFAVGGHQFVRLVADSTSGRVIRTGFYEMLLDSSAVQVLAKRAKLMQEHLEQSFINVEFTSSDKLFIKKAGQYYPVSSKASVMRLFADRGKDLQKYLQAHKLKFGKAVREASVVRLARYYCSLPPR